MRVRYAGTWEHRDYPHRFELLDLQEQIQRAGLPSIQQVAYQSAASPELCIRLAKPPPDGDEQTFPAAVVALGWLNWRGRQPSLDAKLVFQGFEEALAQRGYDVESSIRADGRGTPIAMMVRFVTLPTVPEWGIEQIDELGAIRLPEEVPAGTTYGEGSVQRIWVNRYERDSRARQECIRHYGTTCCICGFNFGSVYGELAEGYIHVHHIRPLSEVGGEYEVDPVEDLRPVCPNCHAVLHLGGVCRSIEEVRQFLAQARHAK